MTTEIIELEEYSSQSVQSLFDFLLGCPLLVNSCKNVTILWDMIRICRKYGISKPITAIKARLTCTGLITLHNLAEVVEIAEWLEEDHDFKQVAEELIERCITLARYNISSIEKMTAFLLETKLRKEQVVRVIEAIKSRNTATLRWRWN